MNRTYRMTEQQFEQVLKEKFEKHKLNEMEDSEEMSREEFEAFNAFRNYMQLLDDLSKVSTVLLHIPSYHVETIKAKEDYERMGIEGLFPTRVPEYVGFMLTSILNGEHEEFSKNKNMLQFRIMIDEEMPRFSNAPEYAKEGFEAYGRYKEIGERPDNGVNGLFWALGWLFNAAITGTTNVNDKKARDVIKMQIDAYDKPGNKMYGASLNENSYENDSEDEKTLKLIKASILASEICNAGGTLDNNPYDKDSQYAEHNIFIDAFNICQRRNKRKSRPKKA